MTKPISVDEAVLALRADPRQADFLRDVFWGSDVMDSARRFAQGGEFKAELRVLDGVEGKRVLDVGAGVGVAAWAMAKAGAAWVVALEPDPSSLVGRGAMEPLRRDAGFEVCDSVGEHLPFEDGAFDLVFARQVLHHIHPLPPFLAEMSRVLAPGGRLLAVREHVCDDENQLKAFLASHPVHRLAHNEGAHSLEVYRSAFGEAGFNLLQEWGPLDSVINAWPQVNDEAGLAELWRRPLRHLGPLQGFVASLPGIRFTLSALKRRLALKAPGRLYSFLAEKA